MTNREGLLELAGEYLAALSGREPARAPLAEGARYTENCREMAFGEGPWTTAGAIGYCRVVADAERGQAGIFAVTEEPAGLTTFAVRLAAKHGCITEAETLVTREGESSIWAPDALVTPNPIFERVEPAHTRRERDELVRIANEYFEGLQNNSVDNVPFHPECTRFENGVLATGNPRILRGMRCREQFEQKVFSYIEEVRERRFPIVDEERGLVWAEVFLDVPGNVATFQAGNREQALPAHVRQPRSTLLFELFKIENGLIREIEAFMVNTPYGTPSGWATS